MAHDLRILAVLPLGDDQLGNASVMHKLAPAVEAFKKAILALAPDATTEVNLVRVRAPKLKVVASAPEPDTEPPAELPVEQDEPAPKPAKAGAAPWLSKKTEAA